MTKEQRVIRFYMILMIIAVTILSFSCVGLYRLLQAHSEQIKQFGINIQENHRYHLEVERNILEHMSEWYGDRVSKFIDIY